MATTYTDVVFSNQLQNGITALKLNKLRDDLSSGIDQSNTVPPAAHASTHLDNGTDPIAVATTSRTGLAPKLSGNATTYLNGTGLYTVPPSGGGGGGDMFKATYDTNNNGVVDTCDSLAWGKLTGVPATFPPDSTAMLKSVYDTNANGVVDTCDSLAYSKLTGTPTVPAPSSSVPVMDGTAAIGVGTTYARNDHVHPSDTSRLPITGGTLTGPLTVLPAAGLGPVCLTLAGNPTDGWAQAYMNKASGTTGVGCAIVTTVGGSPGYRWALSIGDNTVESGGNTGSDFKLEAYSDAGASLGVMLKILRANGIATFGGPVILAADPASALGAATKQYVDAKTPLAHAATHLDNGSDPIAVVTALRTGLAPKLSGSATQYLDGTGAYSTPAPAGTVNPGTWTNLAYGTGWSQSTTAQFRVETNGSFQTVIAKGSITQAAGAASLAFTLPAGARPSAVRNVVLGGSQLADTPDVVLYHCNIDTGGAVTIVPMVKHLFVWPIAPDSQTVFLDALRFEL